jgi:cytosine/adenosine deaminase-related metal-dependent hydrolase
VETAADAGVGVHIHVAEDGTDQHDAQTWYGMTTVERLAAAGVLGPGALLAHCVRVSDSEADQIAATGATVAHNPRSNMNNRVGYSPLAPAAPRVALGTDGIGGDMITESQVGYFRAMDARAGTGPDWALRRLAEGARLAGRSFGEPLLGRIAPGAPADLTVLSYPSPTPLAGGNLAGHWVFGVSPGQVRDVIVAGELVVDGGRSTRVDEAAVAAEAAAETTRLWQRLEQIPPHPFTPAEADPMAGAPGPGRKAGR